MTAVERHLLPATHGGEWEPDLWQGRPDWHTRAACRGVGPEVFFLQRGDSRGLALALSYCARCPVVDECRDFAASQPALLVGIWGGEAGRARRIRRRHVPAAVNRRADR